MKALLVSGGTLQQTEWNVEDILSTTTTKQDFITRMIDEQWFEQESICGLTYGEIRQLNEYTLR